MNQNVNDKVKPRTKKDVKWYSYVTKESDLKLRNFMDDFEAKNQAKLIRRFVSNSIDYINQIYQKKPLDGPKKYIEENYDDYIRNAIDKYEEGEGLFEDLKQKLSPLKLSILMLENHLTNSENLRIAMNDIQDAFQELENLVKQKFEKPKLIRFIKTVDILYIEDNELERKTIESFFKTKNVEIKSMETSDEALYMLNTLTPKVILTDIGLKTSSINGDKFCQIIKAKEEYRKIPVILISALVSKFKMYEIKNNTAADEIIIKPIEKLTDLNIIFKYLKSPN